MQCGRLQGSVSKAWTVDTSCQSQWSVLVALYVMQHLRRKKNTISASAEHCVTMLQAESVPQQFDSNRPRFAVHHQVHSRQQHGVTTTANQLQYFPCCEALEAASYTTCQKHL